MKNKRKSKGYWDDFANVKRELLTFVTKHGTKGVMPTDAEMVAAARRDLTNAIRKHGGVSDVAKRLGLERPSASRPAGYWKDFANIEKELRNFATNHGTEGVMPTSRELSAAGLKSLVNAITDHGGFGVVAEQLGWEAQGGKPAGYWDDFTNVEKELLSFINEHGISGIMPTQTVLAASGRSDLSSAITTKHGGFVTVAKRLGLKRLDTTKPDRYWNDFANVEKELRAFINEHDMDGIMPTHDQLINAGYRGLVKAIDKKHGGFRAVAKHLVLELDRPDGRKRAGYWKNFGNVERELRAFIAEHGMDGIMPTNAQLTSAGRSDLATAIGEHEGFRAVAEQLGLCYKGAKPTGYWDDFTNVRTILQTLEGNYLPLLLNMVWMVSCQLMPN